MSEKIEDGQKNTCFVKKTEEMKLHLEDKIKKIQDFQNSYLCFSNALSDKMKNYTENDFLVPLVSAIKCMESEDAEKVYSMFSPEMADKIRNLSNDENANVDIDFVSEYINYNDKDLADDMACKIIPKLRHLKLDDREEILSKIKEDNQTVYEIIDSSYFGSEDILCISDRNLQKVMRELSEDIIIKAMKIMSEKVQEKFYRCVSANTAKFLKQEMEHLENFSRNESDENLNMIIKVIQRLESCGEIVIPRNSDGDDIVF